jgi:hypothetical protein
MEAISLSFDDFDFIIDSFQLPCMNWIVTVIEDPIVVTPQGLGKLFHLRMVNSLCQHTPLLNGFLCPCPGSVGPDVFEFLFKNHYRIDDLVQLEQLFEVFSIFRLSDIPSIFQQKVFCALEDVFVFLRGFPVFAVTHFIDDPVELGYHMEEIEDDLDMRNLALDGQDIGIPHIHHYGLQAFSLFGRHGREESPKSPGFSVFAHPNHSPGLVVENHSQVAVAFADGDLVYGQDTKPLIIGCPVVSLQELLIDSLDCFPVQTQMTSYPLDSHKLAKLVNVTRQSLGHPQIRIEEIEFFDGNLLTVGTNDLPVMAEDPDPGLSKVQVSDPPFLLAVDPSGLLPTDMTDGLQSFVRDCLQVGFLGIAGYSLPDNTDSRKGEIMCYTQ